MLSIPFSHFPCAYGCRNDSPALDFQARQESEKPTFLQRGKSERTIGILKGEHQKDEAYKREPSLPVTSLSSLGLQEASGPTPSFHSSHQLCFSQSYLEQRMLSYKAQLSLFICIIRRALLPLMIQREGKEWVDLIFQSTFLPHQST